MYIQLHLHSEFMRSAHSKKSCIVFVIGNHCSGHAVWDIRFSYGCSCRAASVTERRRARKYIKSSKKLTEPSAVSES